LGDSTNDGTTTPKTATESKRSRLEQRNSPALATVNLNVNTYVIGEDDAPLPDLVLPVNVRQTTATTGKIASFVIAFDNINMPTK